MITCVTFAAQGYGGDDAAVHRVDDQCFAAQATGASSAVRSAWR